MLLRGRTVLAMVTAAAILSCSATVTVLGQTGAVDGLFRRGGSPMGETSSDSKPTAAEGLSAAEADKLGRAVRLIAGRSFYAVDRDKLIDGAIAGMVGSLNDPYSEYYSKEAAQRLSDPANAAFTGIGVKLDIADGTLTVSRVMSGTPAERAGLQAGDTLLSVNGESLEGLSLAEAADRIRGPKGTKAKLRVKRANSPDPVELELIRDRIAAETVSSELGTDGVGTLRIRQFGFDTPGLVKSKLEELEHGGMKALVVDLRDNPGGVVDSARSVAELFVPGGSTIVIEEDAQGRKQERVADAEDSKRSYPLVVLINGGSASAAEMLAGALKQSAGATLVGTPTYGKGTVQISFADELGDGSLMKLTVMKWLLPDGTWIQGKGILPDIKISQPPTQDSPKDAQWQAARQEALRLAEGELSKGLEEGFRRLPVE